MQRARQSAPAIRAHVCAARGDELNRIIDEHGAEEARRFARTKAERRRVDAAIACRDAEICRVVYACAAIVTLPHRAGEVLTSWERDWYGVRYRWEQGSAQGAVPGLPSGALARRILIHFVSEAVRAAARLAHLDPSLYQWSRSLTAASMGGMTYRNVAAQLQRIGACRLSMTAADTYSAALPIHVSWPGGETVDDRVRSAALGEKIARAQLAGLVPLQRAAVMQVGRSSIAIDLYIWLAWRLPLLSSSEEIDWPTLGAMFCAGYKQRRQSKPVLAEALCLVLAVYPEAQVELLREGIVLYPSRAAAS